MRSERQRVVVTGAGLATPLGTGVETNWEALVAGRSGVRRVTRFPVNGFPTQIAGEVPDFEPEAWIERKDVKKMDRFIQLAVACTQMAVDAAGLRLDPERPGDGGVIIGVGMGGLASIEECFRLYTRSGLRHISPFFVPKLIPNLAAGQIAIRFGAKGVNYAISSACASGGHAIGEAYHLIRRGVQDAMIAGGSEAVVTELGLGGFVAMRALSTRNDAPERASRPFDRGRDGFVLSEGAGVMILESLARAQGRGAPILAEVIGYGATADAYHITAPDPEGKGAASCMERALADAGIAAAEVDHINAHGTSTPQGDVNETEAIKRVFGEQAWRLAVSSTKSMTGHLLGAAGAVEAIYTVLALARGVVPPTINHEEPDPDCDLDYVPNRARPAPIGVALSNAFGFGGSNACLVLRRWDGA